MMSRIAHSDHRTFDTFSNSSKEYLYNIELNTHFKPYRVKRVYCIGFPSRPSFGHTVQSLGSRRPRDRARARPQNDGACGDREGDPEPARPTSPRPLREDAPRGRQRRSETARRTRTAAGRPRRIDRDDDGCARRRDARRRREGDEEGDRASKARGRAKGGRR